MFHFCDDCNSHHDEKASCNTFQYITTSRRLRSDTTSAPTRAYLLSVPISGHTPTHRTPSHSLQDTAIRATEIATCYSERSAQNFIMMLMTGAMLLILARFPYIASSLFCRRAIFTPRNCLFLPDIIVPRHGSHGTLRKDQCDVMLVSDVFHHGVPPWLLPLFHPVCVRSFS